MDINKLNDRITQLEEQNENLVNYINTFMKYHMRTNPRQPYYNDGLNEKLNALPPIERPPPPPPPPLPIAAEIIQILTIPSAPPKPPRKKIMC